MKQFIVGILTMLLLGVVGASATSAQRIDTPTYGQRGAYAVGTRELQIDDPTRPLSATIWYPALNPSDADPAITYHDGLLAITGNALRDAEVDPSGGPYPLVVFSHGNGGLRFQSLFFTERLASYGFIVMAIDHPDDTIADALAGRIDTKALVESMALRPLDLLRLIDYADRLNSDGGAFDGVIDMDHIGVTGHSFGGYTALALGGARLDLSDPGAPCTTADTSILCAMRPYAATIARLRGLSATPDGLLPATTDARIRAVVAMAPASSLFTDAGIADISVPTMLIAGSADTVLPVDANADAAYAAITTPKARVVLENGEHYLFVVGCSHFPDLLVNAGLFDKCSDPVWDMDRAHDLIDHFSIAFLLYALKGDQTALAALHNETTFIGVDYQAELP